MLPAQGAWTAGVSRVSHPDGGAHGINLGFRAATRGGEVEDLGTELQ